MVCYYIYSVAMGRPIGGKQLAATLEEGKEVLQRARGGIDGEDAGAAQAGE